MIILISTLVVALNLGGQAFAWNSPTIIGMFCAATVSFVAFVIAEKYAKMPVAPLFNGNGGMFLSYSVSLTEPRVCQSTC
jgi:hypothetical protein